VVGPGWVTVVPTRSCITWLSDGAGVTTGFGGELFFMTSVWPGERRKSTSTSARSAGASTSRVTGTGRSHKPPSAPICHIRTPPRPRLRIRALQPLRIRKRYSRGSTFRNGHTLPLTSMTSPKYSPIQVTPSMSLVGYSSVPSELNWRSWMTSGTS